MKRFFAFCISLVGISGLATIAPALANEDLQPNQRAFETRQTMVLYAGGIKIGNMTVSAQQRGDHYRMGIDLTAGGIVSWFYNSQVAGEAAGTILPGGQLAPSSYQYVMRDGDEILRSSQLTYGADGTAQLVSNPEYGPDEQKAPVPAHQQQGSIDPLTAALFNLSFAPSGKLCDGVVKVFDGRRRYDLHLQRIGETEMETRGKGRYRGPAIKCALVYERHKSFDADVPAEKRSKSYAPMTIWFAPIAAPDGGAPIHMPVKLLAHSDYGAFIAHSELREVKPLEQVQLAPLD